VEQAPQVALQVLLVFIRGYSVHAGGAVLAGAPVRFRQPVEVHQVGQRGERPLRRLLRQRCYPLLFGGHGGRIPMHSPCFSRGCRDPPPRSPPLAPAASRSPASPVLSRRYDFLPPLPPRVVAFAWRYLQRALVRFAPRRTSAPPGPGVGNPGLRPGL